jgi:syntaxin 16
MQIVQENRQLIDDREKEITHVVKSIQDLNEIFKDLATMIVDQVGLNSPRPSEKNKHRF